MKLYKVYYEDVTRLYHERLGAAWVLARSLARAATHFGASAPVSQVPYNIVEQDTLPIYQSESK